MPLLNPTTPLQPHRLYSTSPLSFGIQPVAGAFLRPSLSPLFNVHLLRSCPGPGKCGRRQSHKDHIMIGYVLANLPPFPSESLEVQAVFFPPENLREEGGGGWGEKNPGHYCLVK